VLAVEVARAAPSAVHSAVGRISDADIEAALTAERAVVIALGGGCQMPLGALAAVDGQDLTIHGVVASLDGTRVIRARASGNRGTPAAVGEKLAAQLAAQGAAELLK
jgi:hydroxymethylbilane synthase